MSAALYPAEAHAVGQARALTNRMQAVGWPVVEDLLAAIERLQAELRRAEAAVPP